MYLRAAKVEAEDAGIETEGMANSVSELRASVLSLTNNRVDIMKNDTEFKSTVQIMREIAAVYDSLTDIDAAALLKLLSGKRQANTTAALIKNWDQVENAIQTSMNSAGSAAKENEHYLDSIEGKAQQFAAAFDKLSVSLLDSELVKGFVDTGTGILGFFQKLIDAAGALPVVLGPVFTALMKLKGYSLIGTRVNDEGKTVLDPIWSQVSNNRNQFAIKDDLRIQNDQRALREYWEAGRNLQGAELEDYFRNSSSAAVDFSRTLDVTTMSAEESAQAIERYGEQQRRLRSFSVQATSALKGLGASLLSMAAMTAVVMAISALGKAIDSAIMSASEAKTITADVDTAYSNTISELTGNIDSVNSLSDRFAELSKGITSTGENLSLTTTEYEEYRDIVKQLVDLNPTLIQGYNAQGDAIINQNEAIEKSIQLMRQQQIIAARESIYGGTATNDGGKNNYEATFIAFEDGMKKQKQQMQQVAEDTAGFLEDFVTEAGQAKDRQRVVDAIFGAIGMSSVNQANAHFSLYSEKQKLIENLPQIMTVLTELGIADQEAISNSEALIEQYQMETSALDQQADSLRSRMQAMYQINEGYYELSDNAKLFLDNFKQNIPSEQILELGEDGLLSVTNNLLDSVLTDSSVQSSIDDMYALIADKDNIPVSDFKSRGEEIIKNIQEGIDDDRVDVSDIFDLDSLQVDFDEMSEKIKENFKSAFSGLNIDDSILEDLFSGFDLDKLTIPQLETLNNLLSQVGEHAPEIAMTASKMAELGLLPEFLDRSSVLFQEQADSIDAAQSALQKYSSAVENLATPQDIHESFVEVFDEFAKSAKGGNINTDKARKQMELLAGRTLDLDEARKWVKENEGLFLTGIDEELGNQDLPAIYNTLHKKYKALSDEQRKYVDSLMSIDWRTGSFQVAAGDVEDLAKAFDISAASMQQALDIMESYSDPELETLETQKKRMASMTSISKYLSETVDEDVQSYANAWKSLWGKVDLKIDLEHITSMMGLDAKDLSVEQVKELGDSITFVQECMNSLSPNEEAITKYLAALEKANSITDKSSEAYQEAMAQVEEYKNKIKEIPPEVLTKYGVEIPDQETLDAKIKELEEKLSGGNVEVSRLISAKVDGEYVPSDIQNKIVDSGETQYALHFVPTFQGQKLSDKEINDYIATLTKDAKNVQQILDRDARENGGKGILLHVSTGVELEPVDENNFDKQVEDQIQELQQYQQTLDDGGFVINLGTLQTQIEESSDSGLSHIEAMVDRINKRVGEEVAKTLQLADGSIQVELTSVDKFLSGISDSKEIAEGTAYYIQELFAQAGSSLEFTVDGQPVLNEADRVWTGLEPIIKQITDKYDLNIDVTKAIENIGTVSDALSDLPDNKTVVIGTKFTGIPEVITQESSNSDDKTPEPGPRKSGYTGITGKMLPRNSMASGGRSPGGKTLVGELGRELWISRDGKNKKIVGKDGMEVINMKPGDAIVPNNLTESLIRGGMSSAYDGAGKGSLENWESTADPSKKKTSSKSSSSKSSKDDTYADWLEEQLEIMQHMIDVWNEKGGFEKFGNEILAKYSEMQKFVHDAAEHYRKLGYAETSKEIRDLQDKWYEYRNAIRDVYKDIYETQKSSAEGSISILESQLEMIEQKIGISTAAFQENLEVALSFSVSDDAFNLLYEQMKDNAEQQIELQTQIMQAAHKEANRYRDMGYLDTSEEIQELKQTYLSAQKAITELKQTVADKLVSQFDDFIELADTFNRWDNLKTNKLDVLRRKLTQINQLLSDGLITLSQYKEYMVDVSESIYNEQKDAIESIIDWTMDMLQQQQQDEIDAIQEQVDLYQEKVDLIKETIRLNGDEDDYQRDLEKKLREIAKIQAKIDQLSLDDSREAAAQRAELAEQLAELQEELAELQGDRGIEIQEEALDKENEKFQDASDEKIDILEDQYSSTQKLHDAAIKYIEENWSTLKDQLLQYNYQYGDSLEDEIINKWEIARQAVERYGLSVNAALQGIENENIGMASDKSAILDIVQQMQANSQKWLSDPANRDQYEKANQSLGAQLSKYGINARYDDKTGKWFVGDSDIELYDLTKYPSIIDQIVGSRYPVSDSGDGDNYLDDDYADLDESDAKFQARKDDILDIIEDMYRNQQRWLQTNDPNERKRLADENDSLSVELSKLGLSYYHDHRAGTWHLGGAGGPLMYSAVDNPDILDLYIRYHSGGIAGSLKPNEVAAILERNEAIYTEDQNEKVSKIVELQQKLASALSGVPTTLPDVFRSIQSAGTPNTQITQNAQVTFAPEINISIDSTNKNDKQLVADIRDNVLDSIRSAFSQSGIMPSRMSFRPV